MKTNFLIQSEELDRMRAAIDAVFHPENHALDEFPPVEGSPDSGKAPSKDSKEGESTYSLDRNVILDLFDPKHYVNSQIDPMLVVQRLALIDLFYSTNLNRYSQFGLYKLAERIIELSKDNSGCAYDKILALKAQDFVNNPSHEHEICAMLFDRQFGYQITIDNKGDDDNENNDEKRNAVSIISKYLYFLLEAQQCPIGFPIFDSIVRKLLPKIARKIGISKTTADEAINANSLKDIVNYVDCIKQVASQVIVTSYHMSQFGALDFALWRIGKVGNMSFSLLLNEKELKDYAGPLASIKAFKKSKTGNATTLIAKLPYRFQLWWRIYNYIIQ